MIFLQESKRNLINNFVSDQSAMHKHQFIVFFEIVYIYIVYIVYIYNIYIQFPQKIYIININIIIEII